MASSSYAQGGTARWMSPELIDPHRFGLGKSRPTKPSDCYALGMVIYEIISGNLPFHKDTNPTVCMKVVDGKRPPRGARFSGNLWKMLELCWADEPNKRPSVEDVLRCLETTSEPPSPGTDEDGGWSSATSTSGVSNATSGTAISDLDDRDIYQVSATQSSKHLTQHKAHYVGHPRSF